MAKPWLFPLKIKVSLFSLKQNKLVYAKMVLSYFYVMTSQYDVT